MKISTGNGVTSSEVMNLSDVSLVSPRVRALPGLQNIPLRFLRQTPRRPMDVGSKTTYGILISH